MQMNQAQPRVFQILTVSLGVFSALLATGCQHLNDNDPKSTVELACVKLFQDDWMGFVHELSGEALLEYGSPEGMKVLRSKAQGKALEISTPVPSGIDNQEGLRISMFQVNVTERAGAPVFELSVKCLEDTNLTCGSSIWQKMTCVNLNGPVCSIDSIISIGN
jgi:hypothetical protein